MIADKMITATQTSGAQLAEAKSTGKKVGKHASAMMKPEYINPKALMKMPYRPRLQRAGGKYWPFDVTK